jgi:hypothetical protein
METFIEIIKAFAIFFGLMFGLSITCATIWAIFDWLFNREWDWIDKFIIMFEFWSRILSRFSFFTIGRSCHRSSSSGFKGGSSRGGGAGRSF